MTSPVIDHPLLSHHCVAERYRCVIVPFRRRRYLVCARCAGAFAGLVVGLPITWAEPTLIPPWVLLLAFPDWIASALLSLRCYNAVRVASGLFIGLVYALNISELLHLRIRADLWCINGLAVGIYLVTAWLSLRRLRPGTVEALSSGRNVSTS